MRFIMKKPKRHVIGCEILILAVLLTVFLHQHAPAQADPCSKPEVAVVMEVTEVDE
jgi:hypothetical protein